MHEKFDINRTKIKGGFQSGRKVVTHNSKSDLPLVFGKPVSMHGCMYLGASAKCVEANHS